MHPLPTASRHIGTAKAHMGLRGRAHHSSSSSALTSRTHHHDLGLDSGHHRRDLHHRSQSSAMGAARLQGYRDPAALDGRPHQGFRGGGFRWHNLDLDSRVIVLSDNPRYWPGQQAAASLGDGPGYPEHGQTRRPARDDFDATCRGHMQGSWSTGDGSSVAWQGSQVNVREAPNPRHRWRVWGDPHILNPDGSRMDFSRANGMFEMPDGTHLVMIATGPKAVVHDVLVFPPGVRPSGFGASITTDYGRPVEGRFHDGGPVR